MYRLCDGWGREDKDYDERPTPKHPTNALPGTEAKIRVLEERVKTGLALWHPDDKRYDLC